MLRSLFLLLPIAGFFWMIIRLAAMI